MITILRSILITSLLTVFGLAACVQADDTRLLSYPATTSEIIGDEEISIGFEFTPQDVSFDNQGLAQEVEGNLIPATPLHSSQSSEPMGVPAHISFTFDGEERLWIYPVSEYEALTQEAGYDALTSAVEQLETLLAERPFPPEAPLPALPLQPGANDLTVQSTYLYFTFGRGIRFVGRFVEEPAPIVNENLYFYFQGLTYGGKYYVSFIYPVSTSILSNTYSDVTEEERLGVSENFQGYLDETKEALNALAPEDFTPDLTKLEALVDSISLYDPDATAESELIGPVWKLVEIQETNDTTLSIDDPEKYTLEFLPESQVSILADCNHGGGRYTQFESLLSIKIMTVTQAMCPEGSLSEEYISYLNEVNSYILEENELYIALKFDSVLMKFIKSD